MYRQKGGQLMATITLTYDARSSVAQKALDFILSLGIFQPKTADTVSAAEKKTRKAIAEIQSGKGVVCHTFEEYLQAVQWERLSFPHNTRKTSNLPANAISTNWQTISVASASVISVPTGCYCTRRKITGNCTSSTCSEQVHIQIYFNEYHPPVTLWHWQAVQCDIGDTNTTVPPLTLNRGIAYRCKTVRT